MFRPTIVTFGLAVLLAVTGCGKKDKTPDANPITNAQGPIGQGGDPAAMAVRRGAQQLKAMNDLKQIAIYYNLYRTEPAQPTTEGFTKYLQTQQARDARTVVQAISEGQYVIRVPMAGAGGILAYEKDKDYQGTRVVVMADGSVTKTMPETEFQAALKMGQ